MYRESTNLWKNPGERLMVSISGLNLLRFLTAWCLPKVTIAVCSLRGDFDSTPYHLDAQAEGVLLILVDVTTKHIFKFRGFLPIFSMRIWSSSGVHLGGAGLGLVVLFADICLINKVYFYFW